MVEKQIEEFLSRLLEEEFSDLFLVDLAIKGNRGNQKVSVLIDGEPFVDIDQCASVSRKLGVFLDDGDLIKGKYHLEVSSPGIDTPLKFQRQYKKNIGRRVRVELVDGNVLEGKLESSDNKKIRIMEEGKKEKFEYSFKKIKRTNVLVSFS